jgi:hypothetical protein
VTDVQLSELGAETAVPEERWIARRGPVLLAIVSFVILCNVVLSQAPKMIEPDPYAYRASIYALADGNINLNQQQYNELSLRLMKTPVGGGIMQWHQQPDGQWVSEKNPGYPYFAVVFKKFGALRLAPLFFGVLGCIGLWFGAKRWIGEWGAAFAISMYCSASAAMVFAWRETMPTFTDTSLIACGIGLLIWTVLSVERRLRTRVGVGSLAFLSFGLAMFVRYTSVTVLLVAAAFAASACFTKRWHLSKWALIVWASVVLVPIGAALCFNVTYYGAFTKTGYQPDVIEFSLSAVPTNIRELPWRLAEAMPVFLVALAAIGVMVRLQLNLRKAQVVSEEVANQAKWIDEDQGSLTLTSENAISDRWIGLFLVCCWVSTWGLYVAFVWTSQVIEGAEIHGVGAYTFTRLFVPSLAPIALLAAWLLVRLPRVIALLILAALLCFGVADFINVVNGPWASSPWFRVDVPPPPVP